MTGPAHHRRGAHHALALVALVSLGAAVAFVLTGASSTQAGVQQSVAFEAIEPPLGSARGDRGRPDRCPTRTQLGAKLRCIYGVRGAERTAVVYGDSKVMQYFPAMRAIARRRGLRLVGLMRAGCPPMEVKYAFRCDQWRERNLRRLRRIDPDLVLTSSGIVYRVVARGKRLSHGKSRPILRRAYMRLLSSFVEDGAEVAVVVNPPRAPENPIACVEENLDALEECAFERGKEPYRNYVTRAARRTEGVRPIDVNPVVCPGRVCPAISHDRLVMRDRVHLTATFVETMTDWLDQQLPALD